MGHKVSKTRHDDSEELTFDSDLADDLHDVSFADGVVLYPEDGDEQTARTPRRKSFTPT